MSTPVSLKPELFGKFILLDKVAMGGMAEVYRAKAPGADGIGKIIAIKRILPQYSAHADFIEMFKNEAKIAVNLTQANIAQIYEFGEEIDQFFLTMEFIDGRNLRQILSRCSKSQKALTIEQCVFIIAQVAAGLDYAHRCTDKNTGQPLNIIHRDMSPQNIMVSFEGEVKIVDFGIAKAESKIESTRAGTLKGKFGYMSPEQADGLDLDARTDIFSTGIVLWELLTGERLFVANNELNTIRKIRECQIPSLRKINPNIHEELERITNKSLARDRSLRYQTSSELYKDLSRFLYKINPEFTSQDASLFIKTIFKDEIIEDRKRVLEFSKIQFDQFSGEKTHVIRDDTHTVTYSEADNLSKKDPPKNLIVDGSHNPAKDLNIKVDRGELVRKTLPINKKSDSSYSIKTNTQNGFGTTNTGMRTGYAVRHESTFSKWLPVGLLFGAVTIGGMAFLKNPSKFFTWADQIIDKVQVHESKQSSVSPKTVVVENAKVFVYSIPAGAQITIDTKTGSKTVGNTPAEITVPLNTKVNLSLRRDGYLVYTKDFLASKSPDEFRATLQKAAMGYLDIEVQPNTSDIFIDGQKLAEKSPIKRYPVLANKNIRITAVNPYSNTKAETNITVKQDMIKSIRLSPKKR